MADPVVLRPAVWHSILSTEETSDKITLHNLSLTVHAGVDAWGRPRPQPALLTITITLSSPFSSAAAHDALDASTVHYGQLSKHIKSSIENGIHHLSTEELARHVGECILESAGDAQLKASEMDIFYPKGSLLGEGAGYAFSDYIDREGERAISRVGYLRNLRFNCILGVNANERLAKQAVVVNIWIECLPADLSDEYTSLELILEDFISGSEFETLESLTTETIQCLRKTFFHERGEGAYIRLRVEKPMAVPFADAPSIEILRPVRE